MTDEATIDASTPVTGQSRMDVAWGSESSDVATVAKPVAQTGQVFEQIYVPWQGELNPRWMRNWAIFRHHVLGIVRKGHRPWGVPTKLVLIFVLIASMTDVALTLLFAIVGEPGLYEAWGVGRNNLYGHILGFFPRNMLYYPLVAALLVGGVISEDRSNGTSALYFSRPINRFDYVGMKYLAVATIQAFIIIGTLFLYYFVDILAMGRGWAWMLDTMPLFLTAVFCAILLVVTYTSIGLALSSVSRGKFFPGIALLAVLLGTKTLAAIVEGLFDRSILYLISPYDSVAHVGQALLGTNVIYSHPWIWSLASVIAINAISLYVLNVRVSSMEVTRE